MRKLILFTLIAFSVSFQVTSQGVLGKKAVVKLNLFNGFRMPLNDIQFEYALGKKFSITAGYSLLASNIRPEYRLDYAYNFLQTSTPTTLGKYNYSANEISYLASQYLDYRAYDYDDSEVFSFPEKLKVQSSVWSIGFRKYRKSVFSAPYGRYFSFEYLRGKQKVSGNIQMPIPRVDDFVIGNYNSYYVGSQRKFKVTDREINTSTFQMNFGKQWVKFDVLTIDFSWGLAYSFTSATNKAQDSYLASILARNNGANFGSFPHTKWNTISSTIDYRKSAWGMNIFLRVGYLLF